MPPSRKSADLPSAPSPKLHASTADPHHFTSATAVGAPALMRAWGVLLECGGRAAHWPHVWHATRRHGHKSQCRHARYPSRKLYSSVGREMRDLHSLHPPPPSHLS